MPSHLRFGLVLGLLLGLTAVEARSQELQLERVWEVGSIDGPSETIWSRIEDATLSGGFVYAVDIELVTVRAFQLSGEYVGDIGGSGEGPGEFARPISVLARGDTLSVFDIALHRRAIFGANGEHLRTSRLPLPPEPQGISRVWTARHGWYLGTTLVIGRWPPETSTTELYTVAWHDSEPPDTVLAIDSNPIRVRYERGSHLSVLTSINLGPDGGSWLLGDSLLVTLDAAENRLRSWEITGAGLAVARVYALDGVGGRVSAEDREAAAEWVSTRFGRSPDDIAEFVFPESWSAWTAVLGDDEGNVWIRRGGVRNVTPGLGERWLRLSLESGTTAELEIPPSVEVLRFREGHVVGKRRGEYGLEYLVLYRLLGD